MLDDGALLASLQQLGLTVPLVRRQQTVSQVKPAAARRSGAVKREKSLYFDTESSGGTRNSICVLHFSLTFRVILYVILHTTVNIKIIKINRDFSPN